MSMKVTGKMVFLGCEERTSKKENGSTYFLAKFIDQGGSIYEFYFPGDKLTLKTEVAACKQFQAYKVEMEIRSYQNKAQIDLEKVLTE